MDLRYSEKKTCSLRKERCLNNFILYQVSIINNKIFKYEIQTGRKKRIKKIGNFMHRFIM